MCALLASLATHVEAWALEEPRELFDRRGGGMAFEALCDNLYEQEVPVFPGEVAEIESLGEGMDIPNDDSDEARAAGGAGDFICFPYVLDVEPVSEAGDLDAFRGAVERLLGGLGEAGFDYVTAADFELPGGGRSARPSG